MDHIPDPPDHYFEREAPWLREIDDREDMLGPEINFQTEICPLCHDDHGPNPCRVTTSDDQLTDDERAARNARDAYGSTM